MEFKLKRLGLFQDPDDGSLKSVFENSNHQIIEMTLLQNKKERDVVCVPTHYYCSMGCKMCHLTNFNLDKPMVGIPLLEFNEALVRTVCAGNEGCLIKRTYKKQLLISFMGVGEPLMNIDLICDVFKNNICSKLRLYDDVSYSLSTMFPSMKNFISLFDFVKENNMPLKIHYSLHFPDDINRQSLLPKAKLSLDEILPVLQLYGDYFANHDVGNFAQFHKHKAIELHYTLIDSVNDFDWCIKELENILSQYHFDLKFINFNEIGEMKKSRNTNTVFNYFVAQSKNYDNHIKLYTPPGRNIGSSCGEFTKHYFINIETPEEQKDFDEWKNKYSVKDIIIND